jgi:hypothetical protein
LRHSTVWNFRQRGQRTHRGPEPHLVQEPYGLVVCGVQGLRVSAHSLTLWLETKILVPQRFVFIFILVGYPARRNARSASSIETHSKHLSQFWQFSSSHNGLSFKPHQLLYRKQALLRATSSHWLLEASIMMRSWPLCAECL